MVKTNGREFKKFYNEPWPTGWGHDCEVVVVNDVELDADFYSHIGDTDIVKIYDGVVYSDMLDMTEVCSFETYFKRWKKKQTVTTLVVEIPNDYITAFKDVVFRYKGKIV